MLTRVYRNGVLEADGFDPADVSDYLAHSDAVVWLDVLDPTPADLDTLRDELSLHPNAIEDATERTEHRTKLEPYEGHQFLVAFDLVAVPHEGAVEVQRSEVAAFFDVRSRWLLTVRKTPKHGEAFPVERVTAAWDDSDEELGEHGVPFLLWGLLNVLIERHFVALQVLDDQVESLEQSLFTEEVDLRPIQLRTMTLRRSLLETRRSVLPMREVVNGLLRSEACPLTGEMENFYRGMYDDVLRAGEWSESLRDLLVGTMETTLAVQGNRLNEIMKRLAAYAALVAVPTAIAGIYGMNTRTFPGAGTLSGWWFALGSMVAVMALLAVYFRRKDWL